ncbi:MAG TPA: cation diffusion facilitator family transporter [Acidimicrobiia bacterium]
MSGVHDQPEVQEPTSRAGKLRHRLGHLLGHDHDHSPNLGLLDIGAVGIRATKVSLVGLGITAAIQAAVVVISGSVALLSDTLHNLTDALTAVPLWIAFSLGRRPATRRYTYGFNKAEDWAGIVIVLAIALSAGLVIWESAQRLVEPRLIDQIPWVITAGVVGALGNELVARYRMRVGERIGSEALVTDGRHARTDALTSLAVVVAGIGAAFGVSWVDPVAGLAVAVPILWLLGRSARRIFRRLFDGTEPEVVDIAADTIQGVEGVRSLGDLRVRWHGHQLRIAASISVDSNLSVKEDHDIAHTVEHKLHHSFPIPVVATIHVEPHDHADRHDITAHHTHP